MSQNQCFRYRIDFGFYENPTPRIETFRQLLRERIAELGCDHFSNGLMNSVKISEGLVYREATTISVAERVEISNWFKQQRIKCCVTIGFFEAYESVNVTTEVVGDTFHVDNLSADDRENAADRRAEILQKIDRFKAGEG